VKLFAGLVILFALTGGGVAIAASGTAMGVDPDAEARGEEIRTLVVGADIFIGDSVVTGPEGQVQILFSDRTELVVGPRSSLLIEDYLLRDDGSAGKLAINALEGTFRFVTGGAPKDRYLITTPTGTIGIRGTALDLTVLALSTSVLLYHGAVRICSNEGTCVDLTATCEVGQFDSSNAMVIGQTDDITGAARDSLKLTFAYARSQLPLLREFRVTDAERCLRRPAGGDSGAPLSETGFSAPGGGRTPTTPTTPGNSIR
jgi:hypothetical protein